MTVRAACCVNSAVEVAPHDPGSRRQVVAEGQATVEAFFRRCVMLPDSRAARSPPCRPPTACSSTLQTFLLGLRIFSQERTRAPPPGGSSPSDLFSARRGGSSGRPATLHRIMLKHPKDAAEAGQRSTPRQSKETDSWPTKIKSRRPHHRNPHRGHGDANHNTFYRAHAKGGARQRNFRRQHARSSGITVTLYFTPFLASR